MSGGKGKGRKERERESPRSRWRRPKGGRRPSRNPYKLGPDLSPSLFFTLSFPLTPPHPFLNIYWNNTRKLKNTYAHMHKSMFCFSSIQWFFSLIDSSSSLSRFISRSFFLMSVALSSLNIAWEDTIGDVHSERLNRS